MECNVIGIVLLMVREVGDDVTSLYSCEAVVKGSFECEKSSKKVEREGSFEGVNFVIDGM